MYLACPGTGRRFGSAWWPLLTYRIINKLEKRNLINKHTLNREPVPLRALGSFIF